MPSTSAPYGFVPVFHPTGESRGMPYTIATGYGTAIYKNQPVILNTNGTVVVGAAASDLLGVFAGVQYVDSTGKPTVSNYWPASTAATQITAYVWDHPDTEFSVQADGAIAATAIGDQTDVSNISSNGLGMSQSTVSATLAGAGSQGQFRIMAIDPSVDNAAGDTYTKVIVKIARHQFVSNKVAI